jgi:hypothetical protein
MQFARSRCEERKEKRIKRRVVILEKYFSLKYVLMPGSCSNRISRDEKYSVSFLLINI